MVFFERAARPRRALSASAAAFDFASASAFALASA